MNNFTHRAQQTLALARKEADRFNHNYVGTEHLLLGIIKLGQGTAFDVLLKFGINLDDLRLLVEKKVGQGPETKMVGNIPYTPRVKKVLALAGKEAKDLHHSYVGTEHLLLGFLREGEGIAALSLKEKDVSLDQARIYILQVLGGVPEVQHSTEIPEAILASVLRRVREILTSRTLLSGIGEKRVTVEQLDEVPFTILGKPVSVPPLMAAYLVAAFEEKRGLPFEMVLTAMLKQLESAQPIVAV